MKKIFILTMLIFICGIVLAEEITLKTIVPGQTVLRAKKGVIGETWSDPVTVPNNFVPTGGLIVQGKTGIGTFTPQWPLDVGSAAGDAVIRLSSNTANGGHQWQWFAHQNNNDFPGAMGFYDQTASRYGMIIASNGNVSIGTRIPNYHLEVQDIPSVNGYANAIYATTSYGMGIARLGVRSDSRDWSISSWGSTYPSSTYPGLFVIADETAGYARMVINSSGYVGFNNVSPTHLIHLSGGAYCNGTGGWIAGSDRAYKKDIDYNFKYGIETVEKLRPVSYVHKEDKENKKQIGFIAQDVKEVIPELIDGEEGSLGMSYDQLTAVLVNAIKEQQVEINALKKEVAELKSQILSK